MRDHSSEADPRFTILGNRLSSRRVLTGRERNLIECCKKAGGQSTAVLSHYRYGGGFSWHRTLLSGRS
jgi:hypothetical protein